jgi:hypothetical protein
MAASRTPAGIGSRRLVVGAHYGVGGFLAQRLTAIVLALYVAFLFIVLLVRRDLSYEGWAGMFAVPTAFAGIWGMNFTHMPELEWYYGYPVALFIIAAACAFLYWRFKKSGWL